MKIFIPVMPYVRNKVSWLIHLLIFLNWINRTVNKKNITQGNAYPDLCRHIVSLDKNELVR